ncbi:MAG TPA: bifunctional [glutamate--ammonia ligase]-adenylyl-L-tyrosine phosphorylase/[glutamate--ammonia-ligase] adenylyltransferase [Rhodanobacteraceae bacterium]|nr:bifunctional [glutamate--ammonia ligase]-adenylyl-L-tyrosine phosphorylase/[glutamate--ammonia-ligase] adenylyltransferase [Rhodanobacteraceae bacterium]
MKIATPSSPPSLGMLADTRYAELVERCRAAGVRVHDDAGVAERLRRLLLASDFAYETLRRDPALLGASGLERLRDPSPAPARAAALAYGGEDFFARLRRFRQAEALRLVFRDVNGLDDLSDTLGGTTALYEALIAAALRDAESRMRARYGTPRSAQGEVQALAVMALGKLGGGELNFSSDVDLILAFPEAGETEGARVLDNAEFFARVAREFVRSLSESSENGIAARVDLRLRPFGEAGPVVASFAAMEQYYQREGRDWERYAWIKARPVAGNFAAGKKLLDLLRPFVYRRYFDYTALAGLREMKALIDAEVARRDLAEHLKLGPGGIREIEFIVQLQQLIRGGRDPALRVQGLLPALEACARRGYLSTARAKALREAYVFLRRLENRVQMFADQQTHTIPEDPLIRARLAATLGFPEWSALQERLDIHRGNVAEAFAAVLLPQARGAATAPSAHSASAWRAARGGAQEMTTLAEAGFEPADEAAAALAQVASLRGLSARAMQRLEHLVPLLIEAARATSAPTRALVNLCKLVQAIARRSAYLALLQEHPAARARLARLCAEQVWLAQRVIAQPLLLDDVLDPRLEHLPQGEAEIGRELAASLAAHMGDPEEALGAITEWRDSFALRAGLALRDGHADAALTARRLALVAAAVVGAVLELARRELVAQHGALPGDDSGFAVLGYGSLGGAELGFASDLDLVFIYDPARSTQMSDGARSLEGARWYARLAQRVVHWLSTPTRAGRLYEIDTRLRPDGSKGLLVASLPAFVGYQRERAWTWEHQALVRARAIAGDAGLRAAFEHERAALLALPREPARIVADVLRMRAQWRTERDRSDPSRFDLKQGAGGLLDVEFLLQGLVLRHAGQHPVLTAATDTPGLVAACAAAGVLPERDAQELLDAHAALLSQALNCTLEARPRVLRRDPELARITAEVLRIARAAGFDFSAT